MFFDYSQYKYYICPGFTDMRKGAMSLCFLVQEQMSLNPMSKSMFLFCSKDKKIVAVLVWDNGFWIMKKRIVKGTIVWPVNEKEALLLDMNNIKRLLEGQDIFRRVPVVKSDVIC
ncbi:MAG: IS66 family insertion sequence element accessory protein TnpB [Sphaerochaetaceae bacterium]|nr:IS66 family insertion sequence element accessory protein TnpB [Sphaerochaetaceae bacterium]